MVKFWLLTGSLGQPPPEAITLKSEEWIKDIARTRKTQIRRSLDGTLYSYVVMDRQGTRLYEHSLTFKQLDKERATLLKQFINSAEGRLCGWQDGKGGIHAVILLPEQNSMVSQSRAAGDQEDEWHSITLKVQIIKSLADRLS